MRKIKKNQGPIWGSGRALPWCVCDPSFDIYVPSSYCYDQFYDDSLSLDDLYINFLFTFFVVEAFKSVSCLFFIDFYCNPTNQRRHFGISYDYFVDFRNLSIIEIFITLWRIFLGGFCLSVVFYFVNFFLAFFFVVFRICCMTNCNLC